jgi:hypothetical protein
VIANLAKSRQDIRGLGQDLEVGLRVETHPETTSGSFKHPFSYAACLGLATAG